MMSAEDKSKLFQYHGLHPLALRSTKTKIERSFEHVNVEEQEFISTGEDVLVEKAEEGKEGEDQVPTEKSESSLLKRASVGLLGGSLVAVGVPLVPLPGPGLVVMAGGLSVLATEFPAAQKILDKGTNKIKEFADGSEDEDEDGDEEDSDFVMVDDADVNVDFDTNADAGAKVNNDVSVKNEGSIWPKDTPVSPKDRSKVLLKNTKNSMRRFAKGKIIPMIEKMNNREEKTHELTELPKSPSGEQELVSHISVVET